MNALAIVHGDLRARLGTRKGIWVQAAFAGAVWLVGLMGTGPERGDASPVGVASVGLLVVVTYVVTAAAGGEITFPGEKSVLDLATAPFSPAEVAWGKLLSNAGFALVCTAGAWPVLLFLHALRGLSWQDSAAQAVVVLAVSWGFAGLATWAVATVESEVSRSVLLWGGMVVVLAGVGMMVSWPWHPVHAVQPSAPAWARGACALGSAVFAVGGCWGAGRRVPRLRVEP